MANSKIKGITIELGGDTTKLDKALSNSEKQSKDLQTELKGVNTLLKLDPSNVELLTQKQKLLTDAISSTEDKLKTLKTAQAQVQAQFDKGDITEEQFRSFQREIIATEQKLKKLKDESKSFGSVFEQQIKIASDKVKELGGKVEDVGKKFAPLSATATAGLGYATTSAISLEKAVDKVAVATGMGTENTEEFKEVLTNIHDNNYGEDYNDIAEKMSLVRQNLGDISNVDLQNITQNAYLLEDAFGMDFNETLRGINGLMQNMGLTAEEAFDYLVVGAQSGLNKSDELADNIAEYSQLWGQAGFSAEEMFAILQNGLDNGAYNLDKVNDLVKEMGISLTDGRIEDNLSSFSNETQSLFKQWEKGGATQADVIKSIIKDFNNMESEQEALTLAGTVWSALGEDNSMAVIRSLGNVNNQYKDVTGAIQEANEQMYSGTGAKAEEAMKKIKTAFAELGDSILPIITPIIEKIAELASKFTELNPVVQKIILIITTVVAALAPILIVIGKITTGVGAVISIVGKLMPIFAAISSFITGTIIPAITALVTAIGWPVIAIAAVIGAIVLLWNKCEWFRDGVMALWEGIKKVLSIVGEWIYTYVIQPIIGFFQGLWDGLKAIWDGIVAAVKFAFNLIVAIITTYFQLITLPFRFIWENCKDTIISVFNTIKDFISNVINTIKNIIVTVFTAIKNYYSTVWNAIKNIFINVWNGIVNFLKPILDKIKSVISTVFNAIKDFISNVFNGIKNTISNIWNGIKNTISNVVNGIKNTISNVFNGIKNTATSVWNGIKNAIITPIEKARDAVKGVIDKIKGFFNFKVSLPNIKLPHFSISPKGWEIGDLLKGKIPKLGIEWYAKGAILKKPTVFGINGDNAMVGGEAGAEAIAPISELLKYVKLGVDESLRGALFDALTNFTNTKVQTRNTTIYGINELTHILKVYMPEIIDNMGRDVILDGKKVGQTIAPEINKQLGVIATANARGR